MIPKTDTAIMTPHMTIITARTGGGSGGVTWGEGNSSVPRNAKEQPTNKRSAARMAIIAAATMEAEALGGVPIEVWYSTFGKDGEAEVGGSRDTGVGQFPRGRQIGT